VFGSGDFGQLGCGDENRTRKKPYYVAALDGKKVVSVCSGALHSGAITSDGELYMWGCNDDGAVGRDTENSPEGETLPGLVKGEIEGLKVVRAVGGDCHTIALTDEGRFFCWGTYKDNSGTMGFTKEDRTVTEPKEISFPQQTVIDIAAGHNHDLVLTSRGDVYEWGDVRVGLRASRRLKKSKLAPNRVNIKNNKVKKVFSTAYSNFAITRDDRVFAWGLNHDGQCGIGHNKNPLLPTHVPQLTALKPKDIAGGVHHTIVLAEDGRVFACGQSHYGRLGIGEKIENKTPEGSVYELTQVKFPGNEKVKHISCGELHSLAVTVSGKLYSWGNGDCLQLGNGGDPDNEFEPYLVDGSRLTKPVIDAAGGAQHSVFLMEYPDA